MSSCENGGILLSPQQFGFQKDKIVKSNGAVSYSACVQELNPGHW